MIKKIAQLKSDLINYLSETEFKKDLWFDYTPENIMHKIFFSNANTFLKTLYLMDMTENIAISQKSKN